MPELPEVETVRRGLVPVLEAKRIAHVQVNRPDLRWPLPPRMGERLAGARVARLRRRSKYIIGDLSTGESLIVHLGMSGRVLIVPPVPGTDAKAPGPGVFAHPHGAHAKHDHVIIWTEDGTQIRYNDARRFGAMDLVASDAWEQHPLLSALGPEPLGNRFCAEALAAALAGKRTAIKAALLDQRIVAGLGNIYVCEALWRAHIAPQRPSQTVRGDELETLVRVIKEVLSEAIEAGGSSLRDHRQASGELGYFQHSFKAYGREGGACPGPGCPGTITRMSQGGRSSFYCPRCQT